MKIKLLLLLLIGMSFFTGCVSMNKNALTHTKDIPHDEGYLRYTQKVVMDEKDVVKKLLTMQSLIKTNKKIDRNRQVNKLSKLFTKRAEGYYEIALNVRSERVASAAINSTLKNMRLARQTSTIVEPSEVSEIKKSISNQNVKKFSIALDEFDAVNSCRNIVFKLFTGFDKRFLYYGAIKEGDQWLFYIEYPKSTRHRGGPSDCRDHYYVGPEIHGELLAETLIHYIDSFSVGKRR
jgi:hypothetical protein